jgi:uncharacterized protein DUF4209
VAASNLASADFDAVPWQECTTEAMDLWALSHEFYRRADEAESAGESQSAAVFVVLAHACSFSLRLDNPDQPFRPFYQTPSGGSASLDQIDSASAAVLGGIAKTCKNPAVRARLGDIAWVKVRDHLAAAEAIDAYLDLAASESAVDKWPDMVRPLERAFQIATHLGRKHPAGERVSDQIQQLVRDADLDESGFRTAKLMELLLTYGGGNVTELARRAEQIAEAEVAANGWHRARKYWELAAQFWARAKDSAAHRAAVIRIAETFEAEANSVLGRPGVGHLLASGLLEKAIQVLRRVGGESERIDILHTRLIEVQRGAPSELLPLTTPVDLSSAVEASEKSVTGRSLEAALIALAGFPLIQSVEELRARVEKQSKEFLFMHFFPRQAVDTDGKTIGKQGSLRADEDSRQEAGFRIEMVTQSALHWEIIAAGSIDPARRVIFREHPVRVEDFREILAYHPAIGKGMEMLYAESLYAGFASDLPKAIHLLIPQMENAFRTILENQDVIVSSLNSAGLQEEHGIHALLYKPELSKVLGGDFVFALQALLVEKFGPHLRHRMAHGLIDYDHCFSGHALAVWWLGLRFAMLPIFASMAREQGGGSVQPDEPAREPDEPVSSES